MTIPGPSLYGLHASTDDDGHALDVYRVEGRNGVRVTATDRRGVDTSVHLSPEAATRLLGALVVELAPRGLLDNDGRSPVDYAFAVTDWIGEAVEEART